jgi:multiple sugar transport system permease protein
MSAIQANPQPAVLEEQAALFGADAEQPPTRRRSGRLNRSNVTAYLMLAPMVVLLGIFVWYPLANSFYLSTFEISFYQDPVFVGFQFYEYVLSAPKFWNSIWVGILLVLLVVPAQLVVAFLIASLLRVLNGRVSGFLKTTIYVPTVVSFVVASAIFVFIYRERGGLLNGVLGWFGIEPIAVLSNPDLALGGIAVPALWIGVGVTTLIMLAGMLDIPDSYYEAAELEGAGYLQKTRYITLPLLKNVWLFLLVTLITATIQQFELPLVMTFGGPYESTTTPNLYIFNQFKDPTAYATSFSLTAALLLFVVLGTISALIFRFVKSDKAIDG